MKTILNLKNLFQRNRVVKEVKKSTNRSRAEEEMEQALSHNKLVHQFGGGRDRDLRAIFIPVRHGFKGQQREQHIGRRRSRFYFNKNK